MKLLFLGDLHLGVKNDCPWMERIIVDSVKQAVDYAKANGITDIVQTGDWFDVRRGITHRTKEFLRTEIIPPLSMFNVHVLVGNHDCQFKNTVTPNACREHLSEYDNFTVYDKPETILLDGKTIDMIPWFCEENASDIISHINSSGAEICVGHWELKGYYFYTGVKAQTGLDSDFLKKYTHVISGHYHTRSQAGNVTYVGTPYTITANDENDTRGFYVLDLDTNGLQFITNPSTNHFRLVYPVDDFKNLDQYKNKSVRMIVNEVDAKLTKIETELEKICFEFRTVNNIIVDESEETSAVDESGNKKGLQALLTEYVNNSSLEQSEQEPVNQLIQSLYAEAVSL